MEEDLIESLGDLDEGLPKPSDLLTTMSHWRRREDILPLFNEESRIELLRRSPQSLLLSFFLLDLKGISPLVCTHHIYMEEEAKPVRQPQRRLNPHMQEVVRVEVLKLLQAAPIVRAPNWQLPFEVMCDASDFSIGAVLGQREDGKPYVIYYASKTLNEAQRNYITTEKELLAVDPLASRVQSQIKDKKGVENVVADHLSRLAIAHNSHGLPINDDFPEESLMLVEVTPWYAHIANYLVTGEVPKQQGILSHCHENACGSHFASQKTAMRVLQSVFCWPSLFKDAHAMCKGCDRCQRLGKLTRRNMMPLNPILIVDLFYIWGIDFMGPFPMSFGYSYILMGVDYVSK
ncbi:putative mitochondrial protein [Vitis vinifera]|uniref:Putative mitochondrial protein n=1 Tax=Vitis vinifera TaxID=29760 RepID=A0A438GBI5_VITVI|nr:putative mitochondrial protein [Vitis vinifera]